MAVKKPAMTGREPRAVPEGQPRQPGQPSHPATPATSYPVRPIVRPPEPGTRRRIGLPAKNPQGGYQQQQGRR